MGGADDASISLDRLFRDHGVGVVVVKRGVAGATVHTLGGQQAWIPAYRSERVFKIGTGDVFSGIFAHHWAEAPCQPEEAADLASRAVATYCATRSLPVARNAGATLVRVGGLQVRAVAVEGAMDTLARLWLLEESRHRLRELGLAVVDLGTETRGGDLLKSGPTAVLILPDGLAPQRRKQVIGATSEGVRLVVLAERPCEWTSYAATTPMVEIVDDFTSAVYRCAWAASVPPG